MAGLLVVLAHPDDEILNLSGSMALAANEGRQVYLACATRGEEGENHKQGAGEENLGAVREAELRCAADAIGIEEVIFLGYRDSGMAGSPANDHPQALILAEREEVAERVVTLIRTYRPDVVVTFEPNGGYGHPDHIAIHQATTLAFTAAGDAYRFPGTGTPFQPERLYFMAFPNSLFRKMAAMLEEVEGEQPLLRGRPLAEYGYPDEQITTTVDVSGVVDQKWRALRCHETQLAPGSLFTRLPAEQWRRLFSRETFLRAHPQPIAGLHETSLFPSAE